MRLRHSESAEKGLLTGRLVALMRFFEADSRIYSCQWTYYQNGATCLFDRSQVEDHQLGSVSFSIGSEI